MAIPPSRHTNIRIGTQMGLTFWDRGTGGVYRPLPLGVTRLVAPGLGAPAAVCFPLFGLAMAHDTHGMRLGVGAGDPHEGGTSVVAVVPKVLVIDNYDSFVYNLVQYLGELGADPTVLRHDELSVADVVALDPDAVLISPGPGRPEQAGVSNEVIRTLGPVKPILGVCLGHQCIGQVFGAEVVRAPEVVHGKTSVVHHQSQGVLAGLPEPFEATRYHSLVVDPDTVPADLEITAQTDDGTVMALRHRTFPVEGVQFHPESILTTPGKRLMANFLEMVGH